MVRILFQGDSITDGNRYKKPEQRWDKNHQIGHSYVFNVVGALGRKAPGKYEFINRGISADTVEKISARWQTDSIEEDPDVLSLLLGTNGIKTEPEVDGCWEEEAKAELKKFEEGYRNILTASREHNPELKIILMEPFRLSVNRPPQEPQDKIMTVLRGRQEIIRKIAEDFDAVFIPVQERLERLVEETASRFAEIGCELDPKVYWLWDGVHPTEQMHHYLAELWLESTKDIL